VNEPVWIDVADVLSFHEVMLGRFGGLPGGRDAALLDSAVNRPRQLFAYGEPDPFALAAAVAEGIVRNHPFLDGNKRAGFMAAALFLEVNGWSFQVAEEDVVVRTLALAAGAIGAAEYARRLRGGCVLPAATGAKAGRKPRQRA
jgi:death-on-curing protein